jgi:hypothetical protein
MSRKLLPIIFAVLALSLKGQAPDIKVKWGPVMDLKDAEFSEVIGAQDGYFYTYGTENKGLLGALAKTDHVVGYYDQNSFRPKFKREIPSFEYKNSSTKYFAGYTKANGEAVLYFTSFNYKLDQKFLVSRTITPKGKVSRVEEIATYRTSRSKKGDFQIKKSKDGSKILVYINTPYERNADEKFKVKVLDANHELLWENSFALPYRDYNFKLLENTVNNDGDVYVLGYSTPDRKKGEKRDRSKSNQDYKLYYLTADSDDLVELDLDFDNRFIANSTLSADFGDKGLIVAGFYSNEKASGSFGGIEGSFYYRLNQKSLEVEASNFKEFGVNFMKNFMSDRRAEKGKDLRAFKFRNIIRRDDGGAVMIAEQSYMIKNEVRNANGTITGTTYTYYRNDIIAVNFNPDGSVAWNAFIPKKQITNNDNAYFSSFLLMVDQNKVHFIYNDHKKNAEKIAEGDRLRAMRSPKRAIAVVSTIEADGNVVYDQMFSNKDLGNILVPGKCYQLNDSQSIMFGQKRKKCRFGLLTFQ